MWHRSRFLDCKVKDKRFPKGTYWHATSFLCIKTLGKTAVTQQTFYFKALIRRDMPKKTEELTCVNWVVMFSVPPWWAPRYSVIYPSDLGISQSTHTQREENSFNKMTGFDEITLPFLKCHLIPKCDIRACNASGAQSRAQPNHHTQGPRNSRGTCWNASSRVELYGDIFLLLMTCTFNLK